MLEIVNAVKAEAEQELLLAKAKIEVADSILAKIAEKEKCAPEQTEFEEVEPDGEAEQESDELNGI